MFKILLTASALVAAVLAGNDYGYGNNNGLLSGSYSYTSNDNNNNNNGGNSYGYGSSGSYSYNSNNNGGENNYGYGSNNNGGYNNGDDNNNYGSNYGSSYGSNYGNDQSYNRPQPYSFGYESKDHYGTTQSRQETGDGYGAVKGSYSLSYGKGLSRTVEYVADKGGFRARVKTNEPGVEKSSPADVQIDGPEKAWAEQRYTRYESQPQYYSPAPQLSYTSYPSQQSYSSPQTSYSAPQQSYNSY